MTDSRNLLAEYVRNGSETAFRELVNRYVDLVHSCAIRLVNGDRHLAEDVSQTVFVDLARLAASLPSDVMLGGWLHRHTCFVAARAIRTEHRRQTRERHAVEINAMRDDSDPNLTLLKPVLDEALNRLDDADRVAILLRFFEQRDFRAVADALGGNEDAARMRVNRALGKLHALLSREGVVFPAAALATALATNAVCAAPAGLAASIGSAAFATAASSTASLAVPALKLSVMTKLTIGLSAALLLTAVVTPLVTQHRTLVGLRSDNQSLREQTNRVAELEIVNGRLSNLLAQATQDESTFKAERSELLKLRGEIGALRKKVAESFRPASPRPNIPPQSEASFTPEEELKEAAVAKMGYARNWMLAFVLYANQNEGKFPTNFDQALPLLPESAKAEHNLQPNEYLPGRPKFGLTPDRYEIVYQGGLDSLDNPQNMIVVREKDPWQFSDGGWMRAYAFADGHAEIHKSADGSFQAWEAQHGLPATLAGQAETKNTPAIAPR